MVRIKVLGGGFEVGRSAILVEDSGRKILLDYGVNFDEEDKPHFPLHVRPVELSGLVISHAHLDHLGAAPTLYVTGRVPVYLTKPTIDLGRYLITDFLKISGYYVDYDIPEFENMVSNAVTMDYGESRDVDGFTIIFTNAGHILGSSMIYLTTPSGYRILYTGDVNTINTWTLTGAELWPLKIDTLIIEATYGSKKHPPRHLVEKKLVDAVEEVVNNGGVVLIPAFSVGRSQEVMSLIATELPHIDLYVDGMSRDITSIYLENKRYLRDPGLFEKVVENAKFVNEWGLRRRIWRKPCVIVASAGMLKGGPSLYYLKKIGEDSRNAVFLVSYQAPGTPGHRLFEEGGLPDQCLSKLNARLMWFDLSSHAGRDGLLSIVLRYKDSLRNIVIVHGEEESIKVLVETIKQHVGEDINIYTPINGDEIEVT